MVADDEIITRKIRRILLPRSIYHLKYLLFLTSNIIEKRYCFVERYTYGVNNIPPTGIVTFMNINLSKINLNELTNSENLISKLLK